MTELRTVLITGGTGSLGYRTAAALTGYRVVITGRDAQRVRAAAATLGEHVLGLPLDLSSLAEVRRFTDELLDRDLPPLHAIVCNAGVQLISGTTTTADGFETTFAVNHLAHFLLVNRLIPHLADGARIVLVASGTHDPKQRTGMPHPVYTDARSLAFPGPVSGESESVAGRRRYTTSKLCNVLMAYELARRLGDTATVNAFDPGLMPGTGLARDYGPLAAFAWRYLLPALTVIPGLGVRTPRRAAAALAALITDPAYAHITGRYFAGLRPTRSSADSYDEEKAADLWATSAELTGVRT